MGFIFSLQHSFTNNLFYFFTLPYKTFEGRFELEVIACLALMKAARKFDVSQAIPKWPNDVWVRGHKLSGNLVEDSRYNIPGIKDNRKLPLNLYTTLLTG